ncbi:Mur ligase [Microdochium bolleyi]|uniref:tetrahydrofolate synthase n=1 Tax=Microdochium bolleyi TaxID=196109 RepID=A0A136IX36_9PEZI|nr:Mur ligase [Microdochium bolleyi]
MAVPFSVPSRAAAAWFHVGSTSSFPNISESGATTLATCTQDGHGPPCKVFEISPPDAPRPNVMTEVEDPQEASLAGALQDQVLVFRYRGKFHAVDNKCPHSSYPLSNGAPFDIEDFGIVLSAGLTCPKHGWSFDLFSGRADRGNYRLKLWEVQLRPPGGLGPAVDGRSAAVSLSEEHEVRLSSSFFSRPYPSATTIASKWRLLHFASDRAMARTYDGALLRLASLQSNKAITSLFDPPNLATASTGDNGKPVDLNALAIPEMLAWLERAGLTVQDLTRLRCIHVAGTKGKGSPEARCVVGRVGTYTSPHLITVRERIQLDGEPISQDQFARYFFEVWDAFTASARSKSLKDDLDISDEDLEGPGTKPFYFRFLTIMAFHVFLQERVHSAIIECGIGGQYDSTNVIPQEAVTATIVTQLGIDHVGMLGRTLPEIAWHKAGICKQGRKCFTRQLASSDSERQAMATLRQRAHEAQAPLVEVPDGEVQAWGGVHRSRAAQSLAGHFQKYNQALAVGAAMEHLAVLDPSLRRPEESIQWLREVPEICTTGLRQANLRGRCETRHDGSTTWYIDGAHTSESLQGTAEWFATQVADSENPQTILVFNQQDRDVSKLLQELIRGTKDQAGQTCFEHAIFTTNEPRPALHGEAPRDVSVQQTALRCMEGLSPLTKCFVTSSVMEALMQVSDLASKAGTSGRRTVVLVTGSLHLVSAMLRTMEPGAEL